MTYTYLRTGNAQKELIMTCEFSHPEINGNIHASAKPHSSGFVLCPPCSTFMDDLDAMVTVNRRERAPSHVAGKRL
jgi:hypothetical protein